MTSQHILQMLMQHGKKRKNKEKKKAQKQDNEKSERHRLKGFSLCFRSLHHILFLFSHPCYISFQPRKRNVKQSHTHYTKSLNKESKGKLNS